MPTPALLPKVRDEYQHDGLRSLHNHDFMAAPDFVAAYARGVQAAGIDHRWYWRVHLGLWAARSAARLPGDFVECGVNRGFLASAIMHDLGWDATGRRFWLLDTFAGRDERLLTPLEKAGGAVERNRSEIDSGFYTTDLAAVRRNFAQWRNCRLVVGSIPGTLAQIEATQVAFLHIDLNCTLPEVAALEYLWERLVPGALVLLDDYAYVGYQPQKDGMDAWAASRGVPIASLPTGQGLIIKA